MKKWRPNSRRPDFPSRVLAPWRRAWKKRLDIRRLFLSIGAAVFLVVAEERLAIDTWFLDQSMSVARRYGAGPIPREKVLLIGLDYQTKHTGPEYPRESIAKVVDWLKGVGCRQVVIDVLLEDPGGLGDRRLLASLKSFQSKRPVSPPPVLLALGMDPHAGKGQWFPVPPLELFEDFDAAPAAFEPDEDGALRRLQPKLDVGVGDIAHLCAAMSPELASREWPESVLIDYRIPLEKICVQRTVGQLKSVRPEFAKGATAIVAGLDPKFRDLHRIPVGSDEFTDEAPGAVALAYGYQTMSTGARLRWIGGQGAVVVVLACFVAACLLSMSSAFFAFVGRFASMKFFAFIGRLALHDPKTRHLMTTLTARLVLCLAYGIAALCLPAFCGIVVPFAYSVTAILVGGEVGEVMRHEE